jgi:4-amino-4-deoxy-L-arabinose transferase-like glycosyltransferase
MSQRVDKEKLKRWLSNPYNLGIIILLLLGFAFRIYYFSQTAGQPLWWDEAEYMATAKKWVLGVPYDLNVQRPPLFQLCGALLLFIGLSESSLIFLLVVVPSTLLILLTFILGKELFNERVGFIGAAGSAFLWSYLFWTNRFQPDFISLNFQLLSFISFWKLFKKPTPKLAVYAGLFAALGFYFKISALLAPLIIGVFVLIKDGFSFVKNKFYWIAIGSYIATFIPFALWQWVTFGNPLGFAPSYMGGTGIGQGWAFGWMVFSFFKSFPLTLFFCLFIAGLALILFKLGLEADLLIKEKNLRTNGRLLSLLTLIIIVSFYAFYIRGVIEDRWVFLIIPFIFFIAGEGLASIIDYTKPYLKKAAPLLLVVLLVIFVYAQLSFVSPLINQKKTTYLPIKEASLLIKSLTQKEESVLSVSYTQATTYTERKVYTYAKMDESNFTRLLIDKKPAYIMVSTLEPHHPEWFIKQGSLTDGSYAIVMEYFNSTIVASPQGQIKVLDLKKTISKSGVRFELVYPERELNGVFVYKITYS